MKKQIFLGLILCLFFVSVASAEEVLNYSYSSDYDGIQIKELKYDPYPANPGEYFEIWIQAQLGNRDYAKFEVLSEYPFSIDYNENPIREYDNTGNREVVMHYKVRVADDAVEGENELKLKYTGDKYANSNVITSFPIQISDVQTNFDLVIQEPSGTDVSIAIANIGKNTANSLIVRIPEQDNYRVSGTNGQMVGNLDSGDYTLVSFTLAQIGRGTDSSNLQVQLDYTDSIGERRSLIKEVQFISTSPVGFNATGNGQVSSGNLGNGNFPRSNLQQQQGNSIFKSIWFWVGIIVLVVGCYWYYRKNPEKIKNFFSQIKSKLNKKSRSEKSSEKGSKKVPDWVSAERTNKK